MEAATLLPPMPADGGSCKKCGMVFARLAPSGLCLNHERQAHDERDRMEALEERKRAGAELLERLDLALESDMERAGLSKRERRANLEGIPQSVRKAMPSAQVKEMLRGAIPESGWGILGTTGTGKTMALAAVLRANARAILQERIPKEGPIQVDWLRWESWPILADWLRDHARSDADQVAARLQAACTAPILVLDDLAAERRIGNYGSDYAVGKLDLIIDTRHRECLPTWYTANVDGEAGLLEAYGARLVSRLCGSNPGFSVSGDDLRMA